MVLPALANSEKVMSPSENALETGSLLPCTSCGRTFMEKALERHIKVCQKVNTIKRKVFDLSKKRVDGYVPPPSKIATPKKKILKAEDEFQQCPSCHRKFGDKVSLKSCFMNRQLLVLAVLVVSLYSPHTLKHEQMQEK